jgi:hypothetical protein
MSELSTAINPIPLLSFYFFFYHGATAVVDQVLLIIEDSRSNSLKTHHTR